MNESVVALAAMMGLATYSTRLAPFLIPVERLPGGVIGYMRLMGPASMAALGAVGLILPATGGGTSTVGLWLATGACMAVVAVGRNLVAGVVGALLVAALAQV